MPRRDGTGPMGKGRPLGGRGLGNCAARGAAIDVQATPGRDSGRGFGQTGTGRGWQRMFQTCAMLGAGRFGFAAPDRNSDPGAENQALKSELDAIKKRLDEMETRNQDSR